ncbi:restriction endonuclease subunit S [Cobetia sp. 5-11-6-3]|uniref:restriction endonuclease subunit S n=1 Tax=Cobetia sp. 5-11-6-3 TaxID=2737458 RepID=UPI001596FCAC|nr:restriction endonuclease subunit S [Cobetia sp. 5-11-6-3]
MSFKAYEEYKDSGVEWLGEVPSHWEISRIKFLAELVTGITPPSDDMSNYADSGWPWLRPDDLDESGTPSHGTKFLTAKGWNFCRPIPPHSTLVCCIGSIGKIGFNKNLSCTNQQITSLIPKQSPKFLFYLLKACKHELELYATGNVLRILNAERLGNISTIIPTLPESRKIATFLDHETASIDALIEEQQRLIALLKEKRQAVISHTVTKGLDPNVPMKDSGVEWLGYVPAHWEVCKLSHVTDSRCDGPFGSALKSSHYTDEGVRVIRLQNIKFGTFNNSDAAYIDEDYYKNSIDKSDVIENDILIAGLGDEKNLVGRACVAPVDIYPAMVKADCFRFRLKLEKTNPYFMALQLSSGAKADAGILATGSTRSRIPLSTMSSRKIAVPDLSEQRKIFSYIDDKNKKFDALINDSLWNIELLLERRSALISAAVTGKIDVRDWQPPKASQAATESAEISA